MVRLTALLFTLSACMERPMARPTDAELQFASTTTVGAPGSGAESIEPDAALKTDGVDPGDPLAAEHYNYLQRASYLWQQHSFTAQDYNVGWPARSGGGWDSSQVADVAEAVTLIPGVANQFSGASPGLIRRPLEVLVPAVPADMGPVIVKELVCRYDNGATGTITAALYRTPRAGGAGPAVVATGNVTTPGTGTLTVPVAHTMDPTYTYEVRWTVENPTTVQGSSVFSPYVVITKAPGE